MVDWLIFGALAGLARRAALLNIGRLARAGARDDAQPVWSARVDILSDHGSPATEIRHDTLFCKSARKHEAAAVG
jgi:ATP phosphoribosyltransferase regulatory subunit HisZ